MPPLIPPFSPPWDSLGQLEPRRALPRLKTPSPPYLVDGVPALRVLAQQVPRQDDAGDLRGAALLTLGAQLPRHHVHQQLRAQQGLAAPAAQPQPRHQQDEPKAERLGQHAVLPARAKPCLHGRATAAGAKGARWGGDGRHQPPSTISLGTYGDGHMGEMGRDS